MTLRKQLQTDLASAMKSGDTITRDAIRSLLAAIKQVEIDDQVELDDEGILLVIAKQVKQRRETIEDAERAGRTDLIESEEADMAVLKAYLPDMMSEAEIRPVVIAAINDIGAASLKDIGSVMGVVMPKLKGKADGQLVNAIAREELTRLQA